MKKLNLFLIIFSLFIIVNAVQADFNEQYWENKISDEFFIKKLPSGYHLIDVMDFLKKYNIPMLDSNLVWGYELAGDNNIISTNYLYGNSKENPPHLILRIKFSKPGEESRKQEVYYYLYFNEDLLLYCIGSRNFP